MRVKEIAENHCPKTKVTGNDASDPLLGLGKIRFIALRLERSKKTGVSRSENKGSTLLFFPGTKISVPSKTCITWTKMGADLDDGISDAGAGGD